MEKCVTIFIISDHLYTYKTGFHKKVNLTVYELPRTYDSKFLKFIFGLPIFQLNEHFRSINSSQMIIINKIQIKTCKMTVKSSVFKKKNSLQ